MNDKKTQLAEGVLLSLGRADTYANVLTGLGGSADKSSYGAILERPALDSDTLSILYENDAMASRIVDRLVDDATREGFSLKGADEMFDFASVQSQLEDLDALNAVGDAWRWSRLYGGALLVLIVNDGLPLDEPMNLNSATKLSSIQVVESPFVTPAGYNPGLGARAFRRPEFYDITVPFGASKLRRVHRSRTIRFDGMRVAPTRTVQNNGWGPSILDRVFTEISQLAEVMGYARSILHDISIQVFKLEGLREMLCGDANDAAEARKVMEALRMSIDNLHAAVLDKNDEFVEMSRTVSGLTELLREFIDALVRSTSYPRVVLLGESPAGLNSSGDSELRSYFGWVASEQKSQLAPVLNEILKVLFAIRSNTGEDVPEEWTVEFPPLWQPNANELADVRVKDAQADQIYMLNGVVSADEVRERLISDGSLIPLEGGSDGDSET